ncbi:MAG: ABC transporter ATP-binding protein, partial [Acidimicrobiales bacterium]|nr:ABC transporter ATP-binding protein [Acidimicrobiales bacterium]
VTHDQVEALTMGHRVAVLDFGVLQQCDTPSELYSRPINRFVAGFIGSPAMNLVDVDVADDGLSVGTLAVPLSDKTASSLAAGGPGVYTVGVRPEHLKVGAEGLAGEVTVVEELGSEAFLFVNVEHQGSTTQLVVRVEGETKISRGDNVSIGFNGPAHVFAADGSRVE